MKLIRIIIADDHSIVRRGIKEIISDTSYMIITGEAKSGEELLVLLSNNECDIAVMDLSMPGKNGLEVLSEINKLFPALKVLILSVHPEEKYGLEVLRSGADGYLTKESAAEELLNAINKIMNGGKYISMNLSEKIVEDINKKRNGSLHTLLSEREYEVFNMIAKGKSVSDISEELSLSIHTISTYRARIMEKMNLKNNADLTYYAIKHNLIA